MNFVAIVQREEKYERKWSVPWSSNTRLQQETSNILVEWSNWSLDGPLHQWLKYKIKCIQIYLFHN